MERTNFCKRCRHMVSSKDEICPYCGNQLIEKKKKSNKTNKSNNMMYIIVLLPLILIMSTVCGFYLFEKSSGEEKWHNDKNLLMQPDIYVTDSPEESVETEVPLDGEAVSETETPSEDEAMSETETPSETTAMQSEEITPATDDISVTEPPLQTDAVQNTDITSATETPQETIITPPPEPTPIPYSTPDANGNRGRLVPKFSFYRASSAAEDVFSAGNAFDGNMDTAWGAGRENNGIGEWIMLLSDDYQAVSGVKIFNGNTKDEQSFNDNARIKILEISFSDNTYIRKIIDDGFSRNEPQIIRFDERINTKHIKISILDKYGESDVVCVSEIIVF